MFKFWVNVDGEVVIADDTEIERAVSGKDGKLTFVSDLPKGFSLPFGIHPTRDKQCRVVNRGIPKNIDGLVEGGAEMLGINNENGKCQRID